VCPCVHNAFQQISLGGQLGSSGVIGVKDGQLGSRGVRWGQVWSIGDKWGQVGSSGTKKGQVRLSRVKWGLVGNMVRGLVFRRVRGWVSERFGER
jgi:hypothetical protein